MSYLTPSRYRAAGFGVDVSEIEDAELRSILARASALVDVYCAIPTIPQRYSFSGGTVTGEQHPWVLGTEVTWTTRRVYPIQNPLRTVTSFIVKFTNTYQVEIAPDNLYLNKSQGWAEVVSLAAVVSGLYPVGINFGLYTPVAEINYTYGWEFPVVGDRLYAVDGNTYQATRGFWADGPAPVVYVDGVVQTTGFTLDREEGEVTFDSPQAATARITADYTYTLPEAIAEATAIIATAALGERALAASGMTGLSSLKVAEVALARTNRGSFGLEQQAHVPPAAASLLDSYAFRSVGAFR
jgi:hypothetical protein